MSALATHFRHCSTRYCSTRVGVWFDAVDFSRGASALSRPDGSLLPLALSVPALCVSRSALRRAATFLLLQLASKHSDAVTSPYDPGMLDTAQPKLWHPLHDS